jgi:hypothetical protein
MRIRVLMAVLVLGSVCAAQVAVEQQVQSQSIRAGAEPSKPKPTPEQLERGRQMLQTAEAAAGGLEGGMRAYALLQVARAYQPTDRKKALDLLEQALAAARGMDEDKMRTRDRLQRQIVQAIVPLAPQRADELLDQVPPEARGEVLTALLSYYQKNNELDRAMQVVYRIAAEGEVPYDAVGRILDALSLERASDAQQLFAITARSFADHPPKAGTFRMGGGDFSSLVLKEWKKLPKEMVLDAVHEILKQAQGTGDDSSPRASVSVASPSGAVAFNSMYEFRLFQMLPILRQLDESEAKKLVKQYQDVQTLAGKYPEGMDSLSPPPQPGSGNSGTSFSVSMGGGPGPSRAGAGTPPASPSPLMMQQAARIVQDSEKHPQDALANAQALPDTGLRASTLMGIAQTNARKNAGAAKEALGKAMDLISDVPVPQQVMMVGNVARLYLELEDTASARKAIEKGMTIADKAYKQDTNADDPNTALKAYWPSTEAYRSMLRLAGRISPGWAMELANGISDPEMKAMVQIALAEAWLDVPSGGSTIMSNTKSGGNNMMTSRN